MEGTISTPGTIKKAMTKKGSGAAAGQGDESSEELKKEEDDETLQVAAVERDTEINDDMMTMRTESIAP